MTPAQGQLSGDLAQNRTSTLHPISTIPFSVRNIEPAKFTSP
ncbi:hypothetical protein [Sphingorhabdus sp.]